MGEVNNWQSWACSPQTYRFLKTDAVNPYYFTINPSLLCTSWSRSLEHPSLTWTLERLCWNPPGNLGALSTSCPGLLARCPAVNIEPSPQPGVSRLTDQTWASGPKCGSGTFWIHVFPSNIPKSPLHPSPQHTTIGSTFWIFSDAETLLKFPRMKQLLVKSICPQGCDLTVVSCSSGSVRPKIRAFVPRRKNRATQWTSPADATRKRVYCRLRKPGDSDLLGGRAHRTANWATFL